MLYGDAPVPWDLPSFGICCGRGWRCVMHIGSTRLKTMMHWRTVCLSTRNSSSSRRSADVPSPAPRAPSIYRCCRMIGSRTSCSFGASRARLAWSGLQSRTRCFRILERSLSSAVLPSISLRWHPPRSLSRTIACRST